MSPELVAAIDQYTLLRPTTMPTADGLLNEPVVNKTGPEQAAWIRSQVRGMIAQGFSREHVKKLSDATLIILMNAGWEG